MCLPFAKVVASSNASRWQDDIGEDLVDGVVATQVSGGILAIEVKRLVGFRNRVISGKESGKAVAAVQIRGERS